MTDQAQQRESGPIAKTIGNLFKAGFVCFVGYAIWQSGVGNRIVEAVWWLYWQVQLLGASPRMAVIVLLAAAAMLIGLITWIIEDKARLLISAYLIGIGGAFLGVIYLLVKFVHWAWVS